MFINLILKSYSKLFNVACFIEMIKEPGGQGYRTNTK